MTTATTMLLRLLIAFVFLTISSWADPDHVEVAIDLRAIRDDLKMFGLYYTNGGDTHATGYIDLGELASMTVVYKELEGVKYIKIISDFIQRCYYDGGPSCGSSKTVFHQDGLYYNIKSKTFHAKHVEGPHVAHIYKLKENLLNTLIVTLTLKYIERKKQPYVVISYSKNTNKIVKEFVNESVEYTRGERVVSSDVDRSFIVFYYGYPPNPWDRYLPHLFTQKFYRATGRQPHIMRYLTAEYMGPPEGNRLFVKRAYTTNLRSEEIERIFSGPPKRLRENFNYLDTKEIFTQRPTFPLPVKLSDVDVLRNVFSSPRPPMPFLYVQTNRLVFTRMDILRVRQKHFKETRWLTLDDLRMKRGFKETLSIGHSLSTRELLSIVRSVAEPKKKNKKSEETILKPILLLVQGHILERSKNPDSEKEPKCEYIVEYESRIGSFKMTGHEGTKMLVCLKSKQVYLVDGQDVPHLTNSVTLSFGRRVK